MATRFPHRPGGPGPAGKERRLAPWNTTKLQIPPASGWTGPRRASGSSPDREEVRAELEAHLEDKALDFQRIFPGLTEAEARERAAAEMGDPEEIGKELARIHKPWLGYLWRASRVLIVLLVLWHLWCGMYMDHYYDTHTGRVLWDFDDLPGAGEERQSWYGSPESIHAVRHTSEGLYTPCGDPDQLSVREYLGEEVQVGGQTVSLLRSAQWQRWGGAGAVRLLPGGDLALLGAVLCWTWNWFTVVDDLGNVYDLSGEGSGVQNCIGETDCGPFFAGWQLYLSDVDPAAQWVRLDYGPLEPVFSLTIDLSREGGGGTP